MDLVLGTCTEVDSIHRDEEHALSSGRKRKGRPEQLLPMPKLKLRCTISSHGSPACHHLVPDESSEDNVDKAETDPELHEAPDQIEGSPSKDNNNLLGVPDNPTGLDLKDHMETPPEVFVPCFEPPASSSSVDDAAFKDVLLPVKDDHEDATHMEEEWPDDVAELMISCSDVGLSTLGLSSAKWSIKQDADLAATKPTIDQEFEHYFSMFML